MRTLHFNLDCVTTMYIGFFSNCTVHGNNGRMTAHRTGTWKNDCGPKVSRNPGMSIEEFFIFHSKPQCSSFGKRGHFKSDNSNVGLLKSGT